MYAVLFDIDGTLISTGGAGQLAFALTFAEEFGVEPMSGEVKFAGRSDRAIAHELMRVHGIAETPENWQRFLGAYVQQLPLALSSRNGRVLPGVIDLLDELDRIPHVKVGLLTGNIHKGARAKMRHYGLDGRFAFGGFGDTTNDRDEIARQAIVAAETPICGSMVIGDTIHDVRCARAIDAVAVAVATGGNSLEELAAVEPDVLLADLSDASKLLAAIPKSGC